MLTIQGAQNEKQDTNFFNLPTEATATTNNSAMGQGGSNSLAITCNYVKEGRAGEEGGHKNTDTRQINQPWRPQFINVAN